MPITMHPSNDPRFKWAFAETSEDGKRSKLIGESALKGRKRARIAFERAQKVTVTD